MKNTSIQPSRAAVSNAWILDVRFKIDYNTGLDNCPQNPEQFKGFLEAGGSETWVKVPGLKSKFFTIKEDGQYGSGIYIFLSKAYLDAYMDSDLFKGFGSFPHITELEVKTYRVLAGSEETIGMEEWQSGNAKPNRKDIEAAVIFYPKFTIDYTTGLEGTPSNHKEFEGALIEPMNFAKMWHNTNVPGLRSKYFTINPENSIGTGVYLFINQESLDAYLKSDLLANFKSFPHIKDLEFDVYSIIGGSELTIEVNPWGE